jgi:parallel beta-helix repeat protein
MALTKVSSGLMKPDNNLELEFTSQLGTTSVVGAATGYTVRSNYYDSNVTAGSGATFKFTGVTTAGKAGNVPNADGYFYDSVGRQFEVVGELNLKAFGAVGNGVTHDGAAVIACAAAANASLRGMYIPDGDFVYSNQFALTDTGIYGNGDTSNMIADTFAQGAIKVTGTNCYIRSIRKSYTGADTRSQAYTSMGLLATDATGLIISGCHVTGASGAGILVDNANHYQISNNIVTGSKADGIQSTNASENGAISGNTVHDVGDDCIAVVSYVVNGDWCKHISITGNSCQDSLARGITVVGGVDITIVSNTVKNVKCGLYAHSESSYDTYQNQDIVMANNVLINCGSASGTILPALFVGGRSSYPSKNITVANNQLLGAMPKSGMQIGTAADQLFDVLVTGNIISGTLTTGSALEVGIYVSAHNAIITNNTIKNTQQYGIYTYNTSSGYLKISGNTFDEINWSNQSFVDVIIVQSGSTNFTEIIVTDNLHNRGAYVIQRFLEAIYPNLYVSGNRSDYALTVGSSPIKLEHYKNRSESSTIPTTGHYGVGDTITNIAPVAGGKMGWVCTTAGTFGTLVGVTGSITSGTTLLTVNTTAGLTKYDYINIAGVTGPKRIQGIVGLVVTLSSNADATVVAAAVSFPAPVLKTFGSITA